jgi:uncharacterized membrane protein
MPAALKVVRIGGGFLLLIAGIVLALPGVPGPGIVVVLLGLALLSRHFVWAESAMQWVRRKTARWRG